ncbi:hypothetical protein V1525DRAFT_387548 [Lipomyces kononenkoae]|uniref:Uncharacterized protein n=1 Tax=Lipomyces kononenkoae TaxID=34357 RepID=A0ACC3T3I0_LIPKO
MVRAPPPGAARRRPDSTTANDATHPTSGTAVLSGREASTPEAAGPGQAKLEIDAAAIGSGKDHVWYCFNRLDGKAATRIYPWMSAYKDSQHEFTVECFFAQLSVAFEDPARKGKTLNGLNTLRQGNRSFGELTGGGLWFTKQLQDLAGKRWQTSLHPCLPNELSRLPTPRRSPRDLQSATASTPSQAADAVATSALRLLELIYWKIPAIVQTVNPTCRPLLK